MTETFVKVLAAVCIVLTTSSIRVCQAQENLALKKTAYQISTYDPASLAVDGNKNTTWNNGSCSLTDNTYTNPWWAVNLGQRFSVTGVNVTSRGDLRNGTRLNYFIVGLTNSQPMPGQRLALYNYTLCGQYPATVTIGATVFQPCPSTLLPYRYVIIQTNSTLTGDQYLGICEVEVYGFACDPNCAVGCGIYGNMTCNNNCNVGYGPTATMTCQHLVCLYKACDPFCSARLCNVRGATHCDGNCTTGSGPTSSYNCQPCDPQCVGGCNVAGGGKCDGYCNIGYGLNSTSNCAACDPNCSPRVGCKVRGATYCDGNCTNGYGPTSSKKCQPCDSNCASGCNDKGGTKCDGLCKLGYNITTDYTCAPNPTGQSSNQNNALTSTVSPNQNNMQTSTAKLMDVAELTTVAAAWAVTTVITTGHSPDQNNQSNPLTPAVIALAVLAGILLIAFVVAVVVLIKRQEPKVASVATIAKRDDEHDYQELQIASSRESTHDRASYVGDYEIPD